MTTEVRKGTATLSVLRNKLASMERRKTDSPPAKKTKVEETLPEPKLILTDAAEAVRTWNVQVLDTYDIVDITVWREWRKTQIMPSSSMIASLFGLGYRSFNVEFREMMGIQEAKPHSPFTQKMLDHGSDNEQGARSAYLDSLLPLESKNLEIVEDGSRTKIVSMGFGEERFTCMVTPDIVTRVTKGIEQKLVVAEFKCPVYGILMKKKPMSDVVKTFEMCYPFGKPNHFLQAGTYALAFGASEFELFYFFTDTINEYYIKYSFKMSQELMELISKALKDCWFHINRFNETKKMDYPIVKKKEQHLAKVRTIMEDCFYFKDTGCIKVDPGPVLDEESSDDSE